MRIFYVLMRFGGFLSKIFKSRKLILAPNKSNYYLIKFSWPMRKIVPRQTLLIREVSLSGVLQIYRGHVTFPPPTAYHGVVADQFMAEWKRAESEDLIAERTRLKHGELAHQEGTDDQVFQFLLMQAQQVSSLVVSQAP